MKVTQPRLIIFKVYFLCPTADGVQPRLKGASPIHTFQFKLEGRKLDSRPSIEIADIPFRELFGLYLNILNEISY
jgi:hypothetical protein